MNAPSRPPTLASDLRHLPLALAPLVVERRWVVCRWEWVPDRERWTKVPYRPAHPDRKASSNKPATWGDHDTAVAVVEDRRADGIGFMLHEGAVGAFDLDNCRDAAACCNFEQGLL